MNNVSTVQNFNIHIDTPDNEMISLKNLVKNCLPNDSISIDLTITIAPHVKATIIDDLLSDEHDQKYPQINHTIKLVVQEYSFIAYTLKFFPNATHKQCSHSIISKTINVCLVGIHARADVFCACYGLGDRIFKFKTVQDHQKEHTVSNLVIKSVLDDSSKLIFNGIICIKKGAQHSIAEQTNKNIILGASAKAMSAPQLEIEANDVICKHGAAISKLNNDQVFYLQSRGLDPIKTRELLVAAFLN